MTVPTPGYASRGGSTPSVRVGLFAYFTSDTVDYYSAAFYLTNPELPGIPTHGLSIQRCRFVGDGLHEKLTVRNHLNSSVRTEVRLACGADFADLFQVKDRIRTLSEEDAGYNPIGYHTGTVWPHDNSIIAQALVRYGYREEANRIAMAMLEAAAFTDHRLPEAFAGYPRRESRFPVRYPTACSPQAWATAAPFLLIRGMLGIDAEGGEITCDPHVPDDVGRVFLHGIHAFGTHYDVEATGTEGRVSPTT